MSALDWLKISVEIAELKSRVEKLETALKCASGRNFAAARTNEEIWSTESPFQKIINDLVGPPPYGEEK